MDKIAEKLREAYHNDLTDVPLLIDAAEKIDRMREALEWYAEQARLCRLIHGEGEAGRAALSKDGGKKARAALDA